MPHYERINPIGWLFGERLTSAQMNALDIRATQNANDIETLHDDDVSIVDAFQAADGAIVAQFEPAVLGQANPKTIAFPAPVSLINPSTRWSSAGGLWQQTNVSDGGQLIFPVALPHYGRVRSVSVSVKGAPHSALPGNMPQIQVSYLDTALDSLTATSIGSASDTSASTAAYEATHAITVSLSSPWVELSSSRAWFVSVVGESGANSEVDLSILGMRFTIGDANL